MADTDGVPGDPGGADDPERPAFANVADEPSGLSPDLELIAQLLADGYTDETAASFVHRSAKFVQRARKSNPSFERRVRDLKEARAAQAAAELGALLNDAIEAVKRGLRSDKTSDQLRASTLVFDHYRLFDADSAKKERVRALQREIDDLGEAVNAVKPASTEGEVTDRG